MNSMRGTFLAAALACTLAGCTSSKPIDSTTPSVTQAAFRYGVNQLQGALPTTYGRQKLDLSAYVFPAAQNWTPRRDPLAGRTVAPESCRAMIWNGGNSARPGDYLPEQTPSAGAVAVLGAQPTDDLAPTVRVTIVEATGVLADKHVGELRPTPAECEQIQVDGGESASVVERLLPGFGEQSRYVVRTFPVAGQAWTERILVYRTPTYVTTIRLDGYTATESAFLAFAQRTQDHVTAALK